MTFEATVDTIDIEVYYRPTVYRVSLQSTTCNGIITICMNSGSNIEENVCHVNSIGLLDNSGKVGRPITFNCLPHFY